MNSSKYTDEHIKQLRNNGIHYGYPDCCINYFISGLERSIEQKSIIEKINCKGFVPCPSCSLKILNKEFSIEALITNRKHYKPF
jgi:hypothetical protein